MPAEWFKAAVLQAKAGAEANIAKGDGPQGAGRDARSQTAQGSRSNEVRHDN